MKLKYIVVGFGSNMSGESSPNNTVVFNYAPPSDFSYTTKGTLRNHSYSTIDKAIDRRDEMQALFPNEKYYIAAILA